MDGDKASWILEFILRQPIEDRLAKAMLFRLATPPFVDPHLKRALFLRQLSSDLSAGRISVSTLQSLELLEELDRSLNGGATVAPEALKTAYCAVAVELTAASNFNEAANSIWNSRIADLEKSEARGLVGEELRGWRKVIEEAISDEELKTHILMRDNLQEAIRTLGNYLDFAFKRMGPPLLELIAKKRISQANSREDVTERVDSRDGAETERELTGKPKEATSRGAADSDVGQTSGIQLPPQIEVGEVKEALKSSCIDLQRVVRDPLPEILLKADEIHRTMVVTQASQKDPRHETLHSLMERNPTARVEEWDEDSLESASEKSAGSLARRIELPSPRITRISPLSLQKERKFMKRRRMKKWTLEEENMLREAVSKYGTGRWKLILQNYREVFEDRTEVDLKDKWRNLCRYRL